MNKNFSVQCIMPACEAPHVKYPQLRFCVDRGEARFVWDYICWYEQYN